MEAMQNATGFSAKKPSIVGYHKFNAPTNMAIDRAMAMIAGRDNKAFMRFYDFEKPSLIYAAFDHPDILRSEDMNGTDISRRETGGKIIYIDERELGYSIAGHLDKEMARDLTLKPRIYEHFGAKIAKVVKSMVPNPDAISTSERGSMINIDGKPVASHAMVIFPDAFLYHGVLAIDKWDADRIKSLIRMNDNDYKEVVMLPSMIGSSKGINGIRSCKMDFISKVSSRLSGGTLEYATDSETSEILILADRLLHDKYANPEWVYRKDGNLSMDSRFCFLYYPTR